MKENFSIEDIEEIQEISKDEEDIEEEGIMKMEITLKFKEMSHF